MWWARPLSAAAPDALVGLLDPVERGRRDAFRRDEDRARFTVAASLLRLVGGAHAGIAPDRLAITRSCPDCDRPHGRPTLPGTGLECSISHSGDRVAVAIGRTGAVGVDVEGVERRSSSDLSDLVLTGPEAAELARYGGADGMLVYWTRKEAVLKATGDGLRVALTQAVVSAPDAEPALVRGHRPGLAARTTLRTLEPGPGYLACLAVLDTPALTVAELDATELLAQSAS